MARIAGIDLPNEKRVEIGLTYIYGIGRHTANEILKETKINPDTRVKDLTEEEVGKIIGVKKGAISYYENGINRISVEDLSKLANEYNKSMDYFVGHDCYGICEEHEVYNKVKMSNEEIRFIKAIRKQRKLYSELLENPENLVHRMKIKL
jgi:ribosomal protein S13